MIDCGATSLVAMNKLAIDRNDINTIFISHFHADHIGGLPFFILDSNYVLKRKHDLTVVGPPSLKSRYGTSWTMAFPGAKAMEWSFPVTLRELEIGARSADRPSALPPFTSCTTIAPARVSASASKPKARSSRFSGDTQWTDSLIDVGRDADLFICEAYTRDKPVTAHMALNLLEQHLGQIRPKRLILTHMSNDMLAQRAKLPYETAEDGMIVEL